MKIKSLVAALLLAVFFLASPSCKKENTGDGTIPEIVILGLNPLYWAVDIPYVDLGAIAYDVTAKGDTIDLTPQIVVTSDVDISKIGEYNVKYNVKDASGLAAEEKVRVVKVVVGK